MLNPLQFFFVVSGVIILMASYNIARKERFNALHFLVFFGVGGGLIISVFFPRFIDSIGRVFGVDRGALVLVYLGVVFLFYFSLLLLRKIEMNRSDMTFLVRELALRELHKHDHGRQTCTLVIAAYNEGKTLTHTLDDVFRAFDGLVIVVDDGSRDDTREILSHYQKKEHHLIVLTHLRNRGQGAALETGFEYIRRSIHTDYVVTFDADGQHDIRELDRFLKILESDKHIDIALGSRFLEKKPQNIPFTRRIILRLGILFTYIISQIHLSDTHNGYRVFRSRILSSLHITLDAMGHASEILDIIAEKRMQYVEVPVTIHYSDESLSKGQKSSNALNIAFRMIWKKFF